MAEALEQAETRLKEIDGRASEAESRADRAEEELVKLKEEETERKKRLRELLDRITQAEERSAEAERRARETVSRITGVAPESEAPAGQQRAEQANEQGDEPVRGAPESDQQSPPPAPESEANPHPFEIRSPTPETTSPAKPQPETLESPQTNWFEVKVRRPWAVALLPFITLGIYHLVWWYRINRELRDYGRARGHDLGQDPTKSLLALFPGAILIVPAVITYWRGTRRVQEAARLAGREPLSGWLALLLYLLLAAGFSAYLQYSLNRIWRSIARPV